MSACEPDLLLLCATEGECRLLADEMEGAVVSRHVGKPTMRGRLSGRAARLVCAGVGMVNAAAELSCQIEAKRPALVLQFGIGGAYVSSGLEVGATATATEEIYGDAGVVTPDGWRDMECIGFPLVPGEPPRFNRFPLDAALVRSVAEATGAAAGPFLTLSTCTGVGALGDELSERFGAVCESMEGAAAAHVCALYGVPFLEIRGISNRVEDRDRSRWNVPQAARAAQEAVLKALPPLASADVVSDRTGCTLP